MRRVAVIVLLSITAVLAADKDKPRFAPGPAASYPSHQTLDKITIAAVPYLTDAETATAFGKLNPNKYGVLPVLVILENETGKALRLDLRAEFVTADGKHVIALPPDDVQHLNGGAKPPKIGGGPRLPVPFPRRDEEGSAECRGDRRAFVCGQDAALLASAFSAFSISTPTMSRARDCI